MAVCLLRRRFFSRMADRGSFFSVVATFNFSCLLAPCHDTGQVDEHGLYHGNYSCTSAAHSFDVAACLGTYSTLLMRYEQHEDYETSPRGLVSCPHGENVDIAWPLVQYFEHVHVGVFAPLVGAANMLQMEVLSVRSSSTAPRCASSS